jgi:DNA topoisomerase-1
VQKRGYVLKEEREGVKRDYDVLELKNAKITEKIATENTGAEKNKLFPTDIGEVVNDFLVQYFEDILDFGFTASVEKEFDDIAQGMIKWNEMIRKFYKPFHKDIEKTQETSERATGERALGKDPVSKRKVIVRIGRFGPMVQIGEQDDKEKPRYASLRKEQSISTITLEEAMELFKLPRDLGEMDGKKVVANAGRFGPYVAHDGTFASLKKDLGDDPMTVTLERATELLIAKKQADKDKIIKAFPENKNVVVLKGRWGAFIKAGKLNVRIPKDADAAKLSYDEVMQLVKSQSKDKGETVKKGAAKKGTAKKATTKKTVSIAKTKTVVKKAAAKKPVAKAVTKKVTKKKKK